MKRDGVDRVLVYRLLQQVPRGKVTTYGALARAAGFPEAARAIGSMMRTNPHAPVVPCHRVVYGNGKIGGYGGTRHIRAKVRILAEEGVNVRDGMIVDFEKHLFDRFSLRAARAARTRGLLNIP